MCTLAHLIMKICFCRATIDDSNCYLCVPDNKTYHDIRNILYTNIYFRAFKLTHSSRRVPFPLMWEEFLTRIFFGRLHYALRDEGDPLRLYVKNICNGRSLLKLRPDWQIILPCRPVVVALAFGPILPNKLVYSVSKANGYFTYPIVYPTYPRTDRSETTHRISSLILLLI